MTQQPHLPLADFAPPVITLAEWDLVVINTSGGKDSQTMMREVMQQAAAQDYPRPNIVAIHADLGRMEWPGARELAATQAERYGLQLVVVQRANDLLEHVRQRGRWPAPRARYCTSDHKQQPINAHIRSLHRERVGAGQPFRVLNCLGFRSEESPARANHPPLYVNRKLASQRRDAWNWLPIHHWTEQQVWADIKASHVPHHPAYDLGMPRLSCVFCIYAPRQALLVAGQHNPELLQEYVTVEQETGHRFQYRQSITEIQEAIRNGERPGIGHGRWNM